MLLTNVGSMSNYSSFSLSVYKFLVICCTTIGFSIILSISLILHLPPKIHVMKIKLLCTILFFVLSGGYYCLHSNTIPCNEETEDIQEDNIKREHWMNTMLADPATGKIPIGASLSEIRFLQQLQMDNQALSKNNRGVTWNSRGPWNVGGRTRTMAIDLYDENHLLSGGVSGGIWQSMDAGATWQKVSDPNSHPGLVSIVQDPGVGKGNIWYALSGELTGTSASGGSAFYLGDGAFKSTDNGNTWAPIVSTATGTPSSFTNDFQGGWRIACAAKDTGNSYLYMALYGSIVLSKDTGKTWISVINNGNNSYYTDVAVTSSGVVYATLSDGGGTAQGFYRSGDGVNFTKITPPFLNTYERTVIGINPNNENEVYFLSELSSDTSGGVATSDYSGKAAYVSLCKYNYINGDGSGAGGEWTNLSMNLPVTDPDQFDKFNTQGGYDLEVKVQPGSNTVIIGGTNIYRSTNGFTTPNNTTQIGGYGVGTMLYNFTVYPNHHPDQHDLFFVKSRPEQMYSVSDGGVKFTNDVNASSVSWENKSVGYVTTQFYQVAIDESIPYDPWILGGLQDNGNYITNTRNNKKSWNMTVNGDGAYDYIAPNRAFYVISTQQGKVRKVSLDANGLVVAKRRIDPIGFEKEDYGFINPYVVDPNDNNFLYMPIGKKIARLNNLRSIEIKDDTSRLATGWTISTDTIKTVKLSNGDNAEITALAVSKSPANILYFGTSNKELYRLMNANSGPMVFTKLPITLLPAGGYVSDIAIDPDSAKNIFICYSNYNVNSLFYSNDTGNTWNLVGGNLEGASNSTNTNPSIRSVAILKDATGKRIYFAGTSIGLFSTDSLVLAKTGSTNKTVWIQESPELIGANIVTDIKVRQSDGYVVIGTHGGGVFDAYYTGNIPPPEPTLGSQQEVYPNPANNYINYTFTTVNNEIVQADIYDILGKKVQRIVNNSFTPGTYTIRINTSGLAAGHYFIGYYTSHDFNSKPKGTHFIIQH